MLQAFQKMDHIQWQKLPVQWFKSLLASNEVGFRTFIADVFIIEFLLTFELSLPVVYRGIFTPALFWQYWPSSPLGKLKNSKEVSLTRNLRGWILKRCKIFYKCDWAKIKTRQDVSIYPCMLIFFKPNCSRKLWLSNLGNLAFAFDLCNHKDQKVSNYNNHVWEIRI